MLPAARMRTLAWENQHAHSVAHLRVPRTWRGHAPAASDELLSGSAISAGQRALSCHIKSHRHVLVRRACDTPHEAPQQFALPPSRAGAQARRVHAACTRAGQDQVGDGGPQPEQARGGAGGPWQVRQRCSQRSHRARGPAGPGLARQHGRVHQHAHQHGGAVHTVRRARRPGAPPFAPLARAATTHHPAAVFIAARVCRRASTAAPTTATSRERPTSSRTPSAPTTCARRATSARSCTRAASTPYRPTSAR